MAGVDAVVALLHAWAARRTATGRDGPDRTVDAALDAGLERVHRIVEERLRGEQALAAVEEAAAAGAAEPSPQAGRSLEQALKDAADGDTAFARALKDAVAAALAEYRGFAVASGDGIAIAGDVIVHVEGAGSVAALRTGAVTTGNPPPLGPQPTP
ncbi:hypothetical protein [Streptomyces sp. NPDC020983]|uniref:hypothetical protein n=1 Tax=Streptomyces sp. NPDC020983 TaxID=3365106 RepID=UPI00378850F5